KASARRSSSGKPWSSAMLDSRASAYTESRLPISMANSSTISSGRPPKAAAGPGTSAAATAEVIWLPSGCIMDFPRPISTASAEQAAEQATAGLVVAHAGQGADHAGDRREQAPHARNRRTAVAA